MRERERESQRIKVISLVLVDIRRVRFKHVCTFEKTVEPTI